MPPPGRLQNARPEKAFRKAMGVTMWTESITLIAAKNTFRQTSNRHCPVPNSRWDQKSGKEMAKHAASIDVSPMTNRISTKGL